MAGNNRPPFTTHDGKLVEQPDDEIWIGSGYTPHMVAESILDRINESTDRALLAAIGAKAVNQAIKGVAVAREIYNQKNPWLDFDVVPYFSTIIDEEGRERTRIMMMVIETSL